MNVEFSCPNCRQTLSVDASAAGRMIQCPACSHQFQLPAPAPGAVMATAAPAPPPAGDYSVGWLIPYRNGQALAAYYFGVFALIPCLGIPLGILAFVFGIFGLKRAKQNPEVRGVAHAWVGIILGGLCVLAWSSMFFLPAMMAASRQR